MAKNLFTVLKYTDKIWAEIFHHKYPNWRTSTSYHYNSSSCLWNQSLRLQIFLATTLKLMCNPNLSDIWSDPWIHDIPLAKKPTFFNINESMENLSILDFTSNGNQNFPMIEDLMGPNVDLN